MCMCALFTFTQTTLYRSHTLGFAYQSHFGRIRQASHSSTDAWNVFQWKVVVIVCSCQITTNDVMSKRLCSLVCWLAEPNHSVANPFSIGVPFFSVSLSIVPKWNEVQLCLAWHQQKQASFFGRLKFSRLHHLVWNVRKRRTWIEVFILDNRYLSVAFIVCLQFGSR